MSKIFYPRSSFKLSINQMAAKLTPREERNLLRLPACSKLEKSLLPFLPGMPQITMRGSTEQTVSGWYSFVISTTPIVPLLSAEEASPPRFFGKLLATTTIAGRHAFNSLRNHQGDEVLVLSFSRNSHGILRESTTTNNSCFAGQCDETTFPVSIPGDVPLGELRYKRSTIFSPLEQNIPGEISLRLELKRRAIFYRDTLQLLFRFAQANWESY
jgi:hypothetical protein